MSKSGQSKRHHYIPRFILKNFYDNNEQLNYWNIEDEKLEKRDTKSVFMGKNLYRDEKQFPNNPTIIEDNFSSFDNNICNLINDKILGKSNIKLTREENESLRIFITLISLRSEYRKNQYINGDFDSATKDILLGYQPDGDFESLWKRELEFLSRCREYEEIKKSDIIDPIIKRELLNDIEGYYMSFLDARGGEFVVTDVCPVLENYDSNIYMHMLIPLSPERMLLLNHIAFRKDFSDKEITKKFNNRSKITGDLIKPPKAIRKRNYSQSINDEYVFTINKCYEKDLIYINSLILNEAIDGVVYKYSDKIINSIYEFNNRTDTKHKLDKLYNTLINE